MCIRDRGTTHHDSELVFFRFVSDDVEEVFKVLADDIVGLFVEVLSSNGFKKRKS